jgi:hypothetical protein
MPCTVSLFSIVATLALRCSRRSLFEPWLKEDLEGYKSPIMTLDFSLPL